MFVFHVCTGSSQTSQWINKRVFTSCFITLAHVHFTRFTPYARHLGEQRAFRVGKCSVTSLINMTLTILYSSGMRFKVDRIVRCEVLGRNVTNVRCTEGGGASRHNIREFKRPILSTLDRSRFIHRLAHLGRKRTQEISAYFWESSSVVWR